MHIAHVLLSRGLAGSERSTAESCNAQVTRHKVSLLLRRDHRQRGASVVDLCDPRVNIIEVSPRWWTATQLVRQLRSENPDLVHCHLRRGTRLVAKAAIDAAKVSTLHIGFNGKGFYAMDGLVCNAQWQIDAMPAAYRGHVLKANNSLVPHRRLSAEEIACIRANLGMGAGELLVAAVGRYCKSKGWLDLIQAVKQLDSRVPFRLCFFGAGSQEKVLRKAAQSEPRIQFVGFRTDIKDLYQAFDLLVCPSHFEPLPRVVLEAMDAGTPVLASDIGGCKELIERYGGILFKSKDVLDLVKNLERCVQQPLPRHRPDLRAHYLDNTCREIEKFYARLLEEKLRGLLQESIQLA